MEELQELHNKISSKLVDLQVEQRRLQSMKVKIKEKYGIDPNNLKTKYKEVEIKRRKCKDKIAELNATLTKKLEKYEDL